MDELEVAHQKRQDQAFQALSQNELEDTYEIEAIRKLDHRLRLLQSGASLEADGLNPETYQETVTRLQQTLAQLREGQENNLGSKNPKIPVLLKKPAEPVVGRLDLIKQRLLAAQAQKVQIEDGPLLRGALIESAKASILTGGVYEDAAEVADAVHRLLVDQLLQLEQKAPEQVAQVAPNDPELVLTEAEEEELRVASSLQGAELADAVLNRDTARDELLQKKRQQLIKNRTAEAKARREELDGCSDEEIIDMLVRIQLLSLALQRAELDLEDYFLLLTVYDPAKPKYGQARGERFIKGYEPFFNTVEEVQDVREGMDDFYQWLVQARRRLDFLTEEDLYALSAYAPFRETVGDLLRARRGDLSLALV